MKVRFWGTRGSVPSPGAHTVRYGGNTPCVEVRTSDDELIILDAGTGIRALGDHLVASGKPVRATLAITHPHWDHIQGFPFFKPLFLPGTELRIFGPESDRYTIRQALADVMNKIYFPVKLEEVSASLTFTRLNEGSAPLSCGTISAIPVNHPSFTVGYRIEANGKSIVYISDNEPFDRDITESTVGIERGVYERYASRTGDPNGHIYDFVRGADLLIHDSTYTPDEYAVHRGWGHSPYPFALKVAREAGVRRLVLFHHEHTHDDERVDDILGQCRKLAGEAGRFECVSAQEGMSIEV
jgi:phosphoribosyl 1,2-cyclic phosphodiesterase